MSSAHSPDRLDDVHCRRFLDLTRFGRLAVTVRALPAVYPVLYRLIGDSVVFRTGSGTELSAASHGVVAFEIDEFNTSTREGWCVQVVGHATPFGDDGDRWALFDPSRRRDLVGVALELVSGHRIHPDADLSPAAGAAPGPAPRSGHRQLGV